MGTERPILFSAQIVPSDGRSRRFADVAIAAIARAYSSPDGLPPLLPSGGAS